MRKLLYLTILLSYTFCQGQDLAHYNPVKAIITGGEDALDQVIQTQLTLPKNIFSAGYHDNLIVYFLVDSIGRASKITVHSANPNKVVKNEVERMLKFLHFTRVDHDPQVPYFLHVMISEEKYKGFTKQKLKGGIKFNLPADSSFTVYSRADKAPDYYKNGEEGLKDLLMSDLEYPKTALDKSVEGTVILDFLVETNGFVTGITPRQTVGAGCTEEAIRLIKKTKWQPAQLNNQLVRYKMSYPITFSLRSVNHDTGFANPTIGQ